MARSKSMASIDAELAKVTEEHAKAQARCDKLAARILELRKQKQEIEARQIIDAFINSNKSLQEVVTFLEV
jgi:phage shock protein A